MVKKALFLYLASFVCVQPSLADTSSGNCEDFAQLILRKQGAIEGAVAANEGKLTKNQSVEINDLLNLACSPQFSQCGFSVCNSQEDPSKPVGDLKNPNTIHTSKFSSKTGDPSQLAWVTQNMSCEDFLGQLRTRYQSSKLDENKKNELKIALDLACRNQFKRCNFEACQK